MSTPTTRTFHLGDILTITTGLLVSPRHVDGLYDLLNYMTGDDLFTHQLGRAMDECKPALLRQHPRLEHIAPAEFGSAAEVPVWLAAQVAIHGEQLPVEPLPAGAHVRRDPIAELVEMVGPEKVIVVALDERETRRGR